MTDNQSVNIRSLGSIDLSRQAWWDCDMLYEMGAKVVISFPMHTFVTQGVCVGAVRDIACSIYHATLDSMARIVLGAPLWCLFVLRYGRLMSVFPSCDSAATVVPETNMTGDERESADDVVRSLWLSLFFIYFVSLLLLLPGLTLTSFPCTIQTQMIIPSVFTAWPSLRWRLPLCRPCVAAAPSQSQILYFVSQP